MSAVRVIRQFPPNPLREEECGTIIIQPGAPKTPQIIQGVEHSIQLSSPIDQYTFACTERPESPTIARFQHKASNRLRLKEAKGTISSLEDRVRAIEEERKERDSFIMQWETCDRLAQGLNDLIKDIVMNPPDEAVEDGEAEDEEAKVEEDLSDSKVIWGAENQIRYLPYLFTQWWLIWNARFPDIYPLPKALDTLSETDIADFLSRRALADGIDEAAELLWNSSLRQTIELMLFLYHKRPKGRNDLQHPIPSAAFAHSFVTSVASYSRLSKKQKRAAQSIIDNGRKRNGSFLFTRSTPAHLPAPAPAHAPAPHGTMSGTTRQREVDDDGGIAVKKQKRGE